MLCLHGKPAVTTTTDKGTFWFCGEPDSCHLICSEEQASLYDEGVKKFLRTKQSRPACCRIGSTEEFHYAKIRVVTDASKASFGRPFFVCSKEKDQCRYFEWGDEIIFRKPLCEHGKPCTIQIVKKEGRNHGRNFLCCAERREDSCNFFKWYKPPNPVKQPLPSPTKPAENPLEPGSIVFFTNTASYQYTIKGTGLKFTSSESNPAKAYAQFLSKNNLTDDDDNHPHDENKTPPKKQKRKSKPKKKINLDVREKPNNEIGWWKGFKRPPAQCPPNPECEKPTCDHLECIEEEKQDTEKPTSPKNLFQDFECYNRTYQKGIPNEELKDFSDDSF